jgi:hypothetical protein
MDAYKASSLATQFHIDLSKDFFTLSPTEVERVLDAADYVKYRKPKNANGSRARYFFEAMKRAVRPRAFSGFKYGKAPRVQP